MGHHFAAISGVTKSDSQLQYTKFQEYKTHNTTKYTLLFAIPSKIIYRISKLRKQIFVLLCVI